MTDSATAVPREGELPERALAQRIAAGDRGAFRELMKRYNRRLYRTARSILRDDAEAEEALQEAWLLAYRGIGEFRGEAKLSTWLVRIVANEAISRLRRRERRAKVIALDGADDFGEAPTAGRTREDGMDAKHSDTPEAAAVRAEVGRLIEVEIDRLPEAFRTVFVLRALEEMPVEEVSAALGIPEATVRTRYFRARAQLREALSRRIDLAFDEAFAFAGERCDRLAAAVMAKLSAAFG